MRRLLLFLLLISASGCHAQPDAVAENSLECGTIGELRISKNNLGYIAASDQGGWETKFHSVYQKPGDKPVYIINFEGGPKSVTGDPRVRRRLKSYATMSEGGISVYTAELSTNGSSRSEEVLLKHGLQAFNCDAVLISGLIAEIKREDPEAKVVIIATSFSGLLAMRIFAENDIDRMVLIVPWMNFVNSQYVADLGISTIVNGKLQNPNTAQFRDFYKEYYRKYMKIDEEKRTDKGRQWMSDIRTLFLNSKTDDRDNVMVIQVEDENRYNKDEADRYFASAGVECVIELKSIIHEAVAAHPDTTPTIQNFIFNDICG